MKPSGRVSARRQIDKRLSSLDNIEALARPPRGWVKAIREAVGMTSAQLAKRMSVSQPRVFALEQAEARGAVTIESLERAARALDCRLVYAFVPRQPLDTLIEARALDLAKKRLAAARHTMSLEAQNVEKGDENTQLERLVRQIIEKAGSELWEES